MVAPPIESDEELQRLYNWVDEVPLSRPKRNISRDFSDGVLFAECVRHFFPTIVEMHNYSSANSTDQKMYNWNTLNTKVLRKLSYTIHHTDIDEVVKASPGAIERVLKVLRDKVILNQRGQLRVQRGSAAAPHIDGRPPLHMEAPETLIERSRKVVASKDVPEARGPALDNALSAYAAPGGATPSKPARAPVQRAQQEEVDSELLMEKEQTISELREMIVIMSEKIKKLEQLVKIKDSKIESMQQKLQKQGIR
eukprot:TRINITY_DN15886_c0_g1_i1.p1 TRINITY_DN15886_c0_g1~~TRINITY_DN15886_c0_g1_i1.p1  ORF type:complete len:253 (-),score=60.14 TRINITY_DN15886_c0_g1_i1:57-815(-)